VTWDSSLPVDWAAVLLPTQSVIELVVRASAMYLIIFALLRLVLRRHTCGLGTSDLLVVERVVRQPKLKLAAYVEADGGISILRRDSRG
jgi:hypothetical protein